MNKLITLSLTNNELELLGTLLGTKWYNRRLSRTWYTLHDEFYEHKTTFRIPIYKVDTFNYTLDSLKHKVRSALEQEKNKHE